MQSGQATRILKFMQSFVYAQLYWGALIEKHCLGMLKLEYCTSKNEDH